MKIVKKLGVVVVVLFVVVVLALGAGVLYADSIAKTGIEKGSTYALGVPTTLGSADVGIMSGTFAMQGLSVQNPPGYKDAAFFELGTGGVEVGLGTLTKDVVEIPILELSGIRLNLERNSKGANYQTIMDNLKKLQGAESKPSAESSGKKFIVRQVLIRDVKVKADLIGLPGSVSEVTVPIHEVRLSNVGTAEGGVSMGQLAGDIVKAVMASAAAEGGGIIPADLLTDLKGGLSQLPGLDKLGIESVGKVGDAAKSAIEGLGGVVQDAGKELQKGAEDVVKGVGDGLKGLLPGKK